MYGTHSSNESEYKFSAQAGTRTMLLLCAANVVPTQVSKCLKPCASEFVYVYQKHVRPCPNTYHNNRAASVT